MSFFNPELIPARIYRSTDADAPPFSTAAGSMINILRACLVTGYGTTEAAGWSEPFNSGGGVFVLQPAAGVNTNYQLRLSADSGKQVTAQVYVGMTDINTGAKKLECDTAFKYGFATINSWVLIATNRGVFFASNGVTVKQPVNKRGVMFFCGDTHKGTGSPAGVYLAHTGGTWDITDTDRYPFWAFGAGGTTPPKFYNTSNDTVYSNLPLFLFNGTSNQTKETILSPFYLSAGGDYYNLPIYGLSTAKNVNDDILISPNNRYIVRGVALREDTNIAVGLDFWEG